MRLARSLVRPKPPPSRVDSLPLVLDMEGGKRVSVDEALAMAGGFGRFQLFVVAAAGLAIFGVQGSIWIVNPVFVDPKLKDALHVRDALLRLTSSLLFLGWAVGAFVFGKIGDRFGRTQLLWAVVLGATLSSSLSALLPEFWWYASLRFLTGVFLGGEGQTAYIYVMEVLGKEARGPVTVVVNGSFSVGLMVLSGVAFACKDVSYRVELLVYNVVGAVFMLAYPLAIESPRYLVMKGREADALAALRAIARRNGARFPDGVRLEMPSRGAAGVGGPKVGYAQLMTPTFLVRTAVMCVSWFSVTFAYYGLAFAAGDLAGDVYTNNALLGAVEIPALFACRFLQEHPKTGRKRSQVALFAICGVSLVVILIGLPTIAQRILAFAGKFGAAAAFSVVFVYTGELFPTSARASAMGLCNVFARVGGILAPLAMSLETNFAFAMFGICTLVAAVLSVLLPETLGKDADADAAVVVVGEREVVGDDAESSVTAPSE